MRNNNGIRETGSRDTHHRGFILDRYTFGAAHGVGDEPDDQNRPRPPFRFHLLCRLASRERPPGVSRYSIEMWPIRRFHSALVNASISPMVLYKAREARTVLSSPKRRRIG
jgi:hypothetical protein